MADTTFEEAARCPYCQVPGKGISVRRVQHGVKIHTFGCENERCTNVGERWLVQTNPDGSIPQPGQRGPKAFERPRESSSLMVAAREELAIIEYMSTHPELTEQEARRMLGD